MIEAQKVTTIRYGRILRGDAPTTTWQEAELEGISGHRPVNPHAKRSGEGKSDENDSPMATHAMGPPAARCSI